MKYTRTQKQRRRFASPSLFALALVASAGMVLGACKRDDKGFPPLAVEIFNFSPNFAGVRLNAPLELTFSAPVDPSSVDPDSIRIFTTTTTTNEPDPGAPAIGVFVTNGNVVRFLPRIPQRADLSDAGLRIGFRYAVQVPAFPALNTVRTTAGDPVEVAFSEEFTTLNQTILPAPGDITAEPNLPSLSLFFIDEGIENGNDPCARADLPLADRDSPQVVFTDPSEGESGFGTITGIQPGLGTAFVRMDPITINFSEPVSTWRIRAEDVAIRNTNLGGKNFDIFLNFRQDRTLSELQATVFDSESAFDKASVPQGRYILSLTNFTDLAGNPLVNSGSCSADGTFQLSFATISSPTVPTDIILTFDDVDGDGHVDVGGLSTGANDPNAFPDWGNVPLVFLGGMAIDQVSMPSPSAVSSGANWGNVAFWTGAEMRYDNGYDPDDLIDMDRPIPPSLRLRGGVVGSATAIMAPLAGRGNGPSNPGSGTADGSITVTDPGDEGKLDFVVTTDTTIRLFTGSAATGPILYHYRRFTLTGGAGSTGFQPVLTAAAGSIYPMLIFAEDFITIRNALVTVDGQDGEFGFNGANDASGTSLPRNPGGAGGAALAAGGAGGHGGAFELGTDHELFNGGNGGVPANVLGTLDQLSEAVAGLAGMATGGGGHYEVGGDPDPNTGDEPVFQGGGGAGTGGPGTSGGDACGDDTLPCGQGVGGKQYGNGMDFSDPEILAPGGAGGGGGGAEDDDGFNGVGAPGEVDVTDDGGGGGGGGGGFIGLYCGGDITLGAWSDVMDATTVEYARLRAVGGAGGSTYATATEDGMGGMVPGAVPEGDVTASIGEGEGGGGGGGGGIAVIAGGSLSVAAAEMFVFGKVGGNDPREYVDGGVAGGRGSVNRAGNGGGGTVLFSDFDGFLQSELPPALGGGNLSFHVLPGADRDIDQDGVADISDVDVIHELNQMSGAISFATRQWGDDPREPMYNESAIVMDFFDTLSDSTSYDGVRVLSNIPRFVYDAAPDPDTAVPPPALMLQRSIRVFLDVTKADGGLPDLSTEDPATGNFISEPGFTREIGLDYDADGNYDIGGVPVGPQFEAFRVIPAGADELGKRFARVRVIFDLGTIGLPDALLSSFAPPNSGSLQVSPGNGLGNTDAAPEGVPAVADIRVTFTVGG